MECVYKKNLVEIYKITPNLYFRKSDLKTRGQCNSVYLVGGDAVGVVDVATPEAAAEIEEECMRLFNKPVRYIFITHGHEDHIGGLPLLLYQPVTVFSSHRLTERLIPGDKDYKAVFAGVKNSMRLRMGELAVEIFTLEDTSHSPWDMFIRLPKEKFLCTGDFTVEASILYYHNANVEHWIANLRELSGAQDQYILPGHGDIYTKSVLNETADYLGTLLAAAGYCLSQLHTDEVRDMDEVKINAIVSGFLTDSTEAARTICQKAGNSAQRQLRMVFRNLLYSRLK